MAVWSILKADLQRRIEVKIRSMRKKAEVTGEERYCIFESINEAIIDLSIERGLDAPKVIASEDTESTTAATNYVDLDSEVISVVDGTVRIVAEDVILKRFEGGISDFYEYDPGEDISSSYPNYYCLSTDGSGVMRMLLRPIPDAAYTIAMTVEKVPDEDSISTFPGWYHPALRSLSTAIAFNLDLDGRADQARYHERLKNIRDKMRGFDGPIHIQMRSNTTKSVPSELRATI